ncbi:MAG: T9SS type A sorting domain-containing protein [Paludibacteraceae bacterium]
MKTKLTYFYVLLLILFSATTGYAQTMNVVLNNGTSSSFALTSTSKMYFENTDLILNSPSAVFSVGQIRKITFDAVSGTNEIIVNDATLYISPNPATDIIRFANAKDESSVATIYSLTGALILSKVLNPTVETLDISLLPEGIYFVNLQNRTAKLIKK